MTVKVEKITSNDFDRIYPLLTEFKNVSNISRQGWQVIFQKNWCGMEDSFGYFLAENGKPVGLLGMIYSVRRISGADHKFCDLAAWYVKPEYRGHSISLLIPILARKDLTITTFTASNRVIAVLRKLNFKDVETNLRIIPPLHIHSKNTRITFAPEEIENHLTGEELQIFNDHKSLHCIHAGIQTTNGFCHLMLNKVIRKKILIAHLDYASSRSILIDKANLISWHIHRQFKYSGIEIGDHMLEDRKPRYSLKIKRNHPILFRSSTLQPADIDIVYSEIQLLGLYPT